MKNILSVFAFLVSFVSVSQVSCFITVTPSDTVICPGDSIQVVGLGSVVGSGQSFDFDTGTLPSGWSTTGSTTYGSPCGAGPNGSSYFWAATAGSGTPTVTTASFDVSCGGSIDFEMLFSQQGGSSPCEGPDLANEGVELQYSTDGGATWITVIYYSPGGFSLPAMPASSASVASGATAYTVWNNFSVTIPSGAMTTSTMFRWIQNNSSGTCCDNWGLENISIQAGPCNSAVINWNNGLMDTTNFYVTPTTDTSFVAYVYDTLGVLQCTSDSIFISLNTASLTYDLVDTVFAYCPTDSLPAEVVNMANANGPFSFQWSTGSASNPTNLGTNGNKHDTILYYVTITDGCGFIYPDSVVMIVNQSLNIDTLLTGPSSACVPDGWVSAIVSGDSSSSLPPTQPFYNWTGPGNPGSFNIDATVMQNIPSGYYYFTVIDDFCEETDSVFVDLTNPPIAQLSGTPTSGCGPLNVNLSNSSQNTSTYLWDFGDGTSVNATDLSSQSHTFSSSSIVMLVAYASPTCSDTAYLNIGVVQCGCMDPLALNYDPSAVQDDESCEFPTPSVVAPNVFTPNGDFDNDVFFLKTINTVNLELVIINRWGNTMFEENLDLLVPNLSYGWSGLSPSGLPAEEGTYFYKYKATGINGDSIEGHGFLELVRD